MKLRGFNRLSPIGLQPTGDLGPWTIYTSSHGTIVAFPRSPPLSPPTFHQLLQRSQFSHAAKTWNVIGPSARSAWERASKKAALHITGYNLLAYYVLTSDAAAIRTVERQTNETLLPIQVATT